MNDDLIRDVDLNELNALSPSGDGSDPTTNSASPVIATILVSTIVVSCFTTAPAQCEP